MSRIWSRKIFKKNNTLQECSVEIYEIDFYIYLNLIYFYEIKIQVDKNGHKYKLFRIDVYLDKFLLAVEIYWQRSYFWGKKTRSIRKKTWL